MIRESRDCLEFVTEDVATREAAARVAALAAEVVEEKTPFESRVGDPDGWNRNRSR